MKKLIRKAIPLLLVIFSSFVVRPCDNQIANVEYTSVASQFFPQQKKIKQSNDIQIKDVKGEFSLTNDIPSFSFLEETFNIPNFNYYETKDKRDNTKLIQADVLEDLETENRFALLTISYIFGLENNYLMSIQFYNEAKHLLYNISIDFPLEHFTYFEAKSKLVDDETVKDRLAASRKIISTIKNKYSDNQTNTTQIPTTDLQNSENAADYTEEYAYTNSDGIIKDYVEKYYYEGYDENGYLIDDPIVQIIPKDCFYKLGKRTIIGEEYGFYLDVQVDSQISQDYQADVFVFDITHEIPSFPSNTTGSCKVEPLFQYKYRVADKEWRQEYNWNGINPSYTRVVSPHSYEIIELFLKDVGIRISIENATTLNVGDEGYVPKDDDGAFIIQTRFNCDGVGLKKFNYGYLMDTIFFAFGFIPKKVVSVATGLLSYAADIYDGFGSQGYLYTREGIQKNNED